MSLPSRRRRAAVVLFNLGGPHGPADVEPFLFNLFNDPAIIGLPGLLRTPLARFIARRRAPSAAENYAKMGGGSPLLAETRAQAHALEAALAAARPDIDWRVVIGMRYWTPLVEDAAKSVREFGADHVILTPLYPHFSTTTTGSAMTVWKRVASDLPAPTLVCCYPEEAGFLAAHARLIRETYAAAGSPRPARLLFSAHGLPERVVKAGDPYQRQIEATARAVAARTPELGEWEVCYQSRVGPLKWIGPSTEEAITRASADGRAVILTPIAFVSEHIETLVELDEEYAELAHEKGVSQYIRVPALGAAPEYVGALRDMTLAALDAPACTGPYGAGSPCAATDVKCPRTENQLCPAHARRVAA